MKYLYKFSGLILLLIVFGCTHQQESQPYNHESEELVQNTNVENSDLIERKLIKVGRIEFETDDLKLTRKNILQAVEKHKGYVSSDETNRYAGLQRNTLVIRVPSNHFDSFLEDATKGVEKFDSKEIEVKDVTEEYLDIEARLKTKKELEARYLDLLKKAKNVTEILAIEKQIGELRSEIESIEGRLKYLQNRVSYSTLTITFYKKVLSQTKFSGKFKKGFYEGWSNLIWFFVGLTHIWPFIIMILVIVFGIRYILKKRK